MSIFGNFNLLQQKNTNFLPAWNDLKWVKIIKNPNYFTSFFLKRASESGSKSFKKPNPDQGGTREDPQPWNEVYSLWDNVGDPWQFGAYPDPDPRIPTSDKWIRIRLRNRLQIRIQLRILLLPSLILMMHKKIFFSSYFCLTTCPQAHHLQSIKFNFLLKLMC